MSALEALVWIIGICIGGLTITVSALGFAKALETINSVKKELKEKDVSENDSESS